MNAAFNDVTSRFLDSSSYGDLATAIDVTVLGVLMLVLIETEVIRAARGKAAARAVRILGFALPVLITAATVILVARISGAR